LLLDVHSSNCLCGNTIYYEAIKSYRRFSATKAISHGGTFDV
jgi:hypothetical protein